MFSTFTAGSSRWNKEMKLAFVVQNRDMEEIIKTHIGLTKDSSWEIKIFSKYDEAVEWCEK